MTKIEIRDSDSNGYLTAELRDILLALPVEVEHRSEASAAGATQLNVTGNAIINQQLMTPATVGRVAQMNGFTFRQVNPNTIFLSSPVP